MLLLLRTYGFTRQNLMFRNMKYTVLITAMNHLSMSKNDIDVLLRVFRLLSGIYQKLCVTCCVTCCVICCAFGELRVKN